MTTATRRRAPLRPDAPPPRVLCGLEVAAERLDVHSMTIRRFIRDGKLPAYWVGRSLKVDIADVDKLARPVDPHEISA